MFAQMTQTKRAIAVCCSLRKMNCRLQQMSSHCAGTASLRLTVQALFSWQTVVKDA